MLETTYIVLKKTYSEEKDTVIFRTSSYKTAKKYRDRMNMDCNPYIGFYHISTLN